MSAFWRYAEAYLLAIFVIAGLSAFKAICEKLLSRDVRHFPFDWMLGT